MASTYPSSSAIREHNLSAVLEMLGDGGPISRAEAAARTGLSKPTVASALRAFEQAGLVREFGRTTGRRGPSASLYELVTDAALTLGVDIGARYVRAVLADLQGQPVQELTLRLARPHAQDVLAAIDEIRARIAPHAARTEVAVVGSPGVIDPLTGRIGSAPNIAEWEGVLATTVLERTLGIPVRVENDVNLAALGEQAYGGGLGVESFAYLTVGSGLGAGIILNGRLHRGARGAAGEVGFLPVGADPFPATRATHSGAMERQLSSHGLARMAQRLAPTLTTSLHPPFEVDQMFEAARHGDPLGRAVVAEAARAIAVCVAGLSAVVDLELVLIGGGIGDNDELLLPDVRAAITELLPLPPRVERAVLGEKAVRTGAIAVARTEVRRAIIRRLVESQGAVEA
ncbi:MAG: family transcriptional regulator [Solirubrobacterales bacterium]|nr:family transcriptional regulator [Solirubrobacterales bacterium]